MLSIDKYQSKFLNNTKTSVLSKLNAIDCKNVVIWGTGNFAKFVYSFLGKYSLCNVQCFCVSFVQENLPHEFSKIPVYLSSKAIELYPDAAYLLANDFYKEIKNDFFLGKYSRNVLLVDDVLLLNQLKELYLYETTFTNYYKWIYEFYSYFEKLNIKNLLKKYVAEIVDMLEDEESKEILQSRIKTITSADSKYLLSFDICKTQYFSNEYYPITKDEVLFDCGAFDGDSIKKFEFFSKGEYKKIVAFEPDTINFNKLKLSIDKNNIECYNTAVGAYNGFVSFSLQGNSSSLICEECGLNDAKVKICKLDNFIEERPTLIKMDIEGAELECLKGAQEIIKSLKPKLAVCIYHKPLDFYEIPIFLKSLVPEYKFKIRHHAPTINETVLYAYI